MTHKIMAIVRLRWALFRHGMRQGSGVVNRISGLLMSVLGVVFALGLAAGFAALIHLAVSSNDFSLLRVTYSAAFYTALVFALLIPLLRGGGNRGFEPRRLAGFPIRHGELYAVTLAAEFAGSSHLIHYPTLAAVLLTGSLIPGRSVVGSTAIVFLLAAVLVVWGHVLTLFLQRMMRGRRMKEVLTLLGFMLLIGLSMGPILLQKLALGEGGHQGSRFQAAAGLVGRVSGVFPPSLAADGLASQNGTGTCLWLTVWLAVGLAAGYWIFSRHMTQVVRSRRGVSTRRDRHRPAAGEGFQPAGAARDRFPGVIPSDLRAVVSKELRYYSRSVLGKFTVLMVPLFVLLCVFVFAEQVRSPLFNIGGENLLFFGMLIYLTFFSNNFVSNTFAWDGAGAQIYFFSPVSLQRVLLGKNLALWLLNMLTLSVCIVIWSVMMGLPRPAVMISGLMVFAISLIALTMVGNVSSVLFPVKRDIAAFIAPPSQTGMILSVLALIGIVLLIGFCLFLPFLLGVEGFLPLFLFCLFALLSVLYLLMLRVVSRLWDGRKDKFLASIKGTG